MIGDNFVQHKDGGLYSILAVGKSTVDQSEHIIYVHLYPFERQVWIRPIEEFTEERFTVLTQEQGVAVLNRDREQFQAEITANKKARKG